MKPKYLLDTWVVSDLDLLIASCAIRHQITVATLNASDFAKIEGCMWEDWSI